MKRIARYLLIIGRILGILLFGIIVILILFTGPLVEYVVEKYDMTYLGRQIEIDDFHVGIFSGKVDMKGFKLYEQNQEDVFIGFNQAFIDLRNLKNLLDKELYVEKVLLDEPYVNLYNEGVTWNFSDIIHRYEALMDTTQDKTAEEDTLKAPFFLYWDAVIDDVLMDSLSVDYRNLTMGNQMIWDAITFHCPGVSTLDPNTSFTLDMLGREGGTVRVSATINYDTLTYDADINIANLGFEFLQPYVQDYIEIDSLIGQIDMEVEAKGGLNTVNRWKGYVDIHDFLVTDSNSDSLVAAGSLRLHVDSIELENQNFDLRSLRLDQGYLRVEMYNEGDNWSEALKISADDIEVDTTTGELITVPGQEYFNIFVYIADITSQLITTYVNSSYRIDTISVSRSTIFYGDYTMREDARFLFEDLTMLATNFDTRNEFVTFNMSSRVNKSGRFAAEWKFDPKDVMEMELDYEIHNFLISDISPYSFHNTAYPLFHGDMVYTGFIDIHNREIVSENHLHIEDIEAGKKVFDNPPYKIPVRLAVALLRDMHGDIDLDIKVRGNVDDPKFNYWGLLGQVLKNLLVKAVTAPFRLLASAFKVDEESLKGINWLYGQSILLRDQERVTADLAKVLGNREELALKYYEINNREREKDQIAVFIAKQQYLMRDKPQNYILTAEDSSRIVGMPMQDSLFIAYLKTLTDTTRLYSVPERCRLLVTEPELSRISESTVLKRNQSFINEMVYVHGVDSLRLIKMPYDSLTPAVDTFELFGPRYEFRFDMAGDSRDGPSE